MRFRRALSAAKPDARVGWNLFFMNASEIPLGHTFTLAGSDKVYTVIAQTPGGTPNAHLTTVRYYNSGLGYTTEVTLSGYTGVCVVSPPPSHECSASGGT